MNEMDEPVKRPSHERVRLACALRYQSEEGDDAPQLIASGDGSLADQIEKAARDYGIPVVRDVGLAHALHALSEGDAIPEELYEAIAIVLTELAEESA